MSGGCTLFDLFQWAGVVGGIAGGIAIGWQFGALAAIGGGVLGLVVGWLAGRTPFVLGLMCLQRSLKRTSNQELRECLEEKYFISHFIFAHLASRGESIDDLRDVVERQLNSDSADVRRFAEVNARVWFSELLEDKTPHNE